MSMETPWGQSQHSFSDKRGITRHSTASHGGYHLEPHRQAGVARALPEFRTFAGGPWYEEDQDAAVVVLVFHEEFAPEMVDQAVDIARWSAKYEAQSGRERGWQGVVEWLESPEGDRLRQRVGAWMLARNRPAAMA